MHDKGDDSLEADLRIAAQKYGGKVDQMRLEKEENRNRDQEMDR